MQGVRPTFGGGHYLEAGCICHLARYGYSIVHIAKPGDGLRLLFVESANCFEPATFLQIVRSNKNNPPLGDFAAFE